MSNVMKILYISANIFPSKSGPLGIITPQREPYFQSWQNLRQTLYSPTHSVTEKFIPSDYNRTC